MIKGGYKIIDFGDVNLTSDAGVTVVGTYEAIEGSHRKPLLISGITIDGVEKNDCFVSCTHAENSYTLSLYGRTITVSNTDEITISAAV